jgi:anion transporter
VQASLTHIHPIKSVVSRLRFRQALALLLAVGSLAGIALLPADVPTPARVALAVFALSVIGWMLTDLNDTFVALFAATGLVISAIISTESLFASLGDSIVWLMIGAFIVSNALNKSGVSARITLFAIRPARNVLHLFYLLTAVLLLTALLIPSTSARAALMVPIYMAMCAAFNSPQINRALAVMLPVNILQTAVGSLVGAGAHLIINDTLAQFTGRPLSYIEWTMMGLPFAALSAFGTTWVVLHLFLDRRHRAMLINAQIMNALPQASPITPRERFVMGITAVLVVLWMTEPLHGISNALVAMLGALAVTAPVHGSIKFKDAAKGVEWEMILFVAATLALSEALVQSGAGAWLVDQLLVQSGVAAAASDLAALAVVTLITLTSHLYITSRSARGAVIAPITVLLAFTLGLDPLTLAFVTAAGIGYCITLVVSAKPLTMFQQLNGADAAPAFQPSDLIKLSGVLAPLHAGLIVLFGMFYWPAMAQAAHLTASPASMPAQADGAPRAGSVFIPIIDLTDAGASTFAASAKLPPPAAPGPTLPAVNVQMTSLAVDDTQPTHDLKHSESMTGAAAPATATPAATTISPATSAPPTSVPVTNEPPTSVPVTAPPAPETQPPPVQETRPMPVAETDDEQNEQGSDPQEENDEDNGSDDTHAGSEEDD